jgi:hypothetical protein
MPFHFHLRLFGLFSIVEVDGLELTEEVIDTPRLGGLAVTEEVATGLPLTTYPSLVARLLILFPTFHVSSTIEQVAMPSPMLAHQVNKTSAAVQVAPSLMSASEEEATSATRQVAPRVTLQVTTHPTLARVLHLINDRYIGDRGSLRAITLLALLVFKTLKYSVSL